MNQEVKYFKRVNKNLGLIVEDLSMKQRGLQDESINLRTQVEKQETNKEEFVHDVYEAMQHIPDYRKLKKKIVELYKVYVLHEKVHG
jgi:cilia- and flagella-associated protein 57